MPNTYFEATWKSQVAAGFRTIRRSDKKLIEITVCEWWPGQKVCLPVTLRQMSNFRASPNVIKLRNDGRFLQSIGW
jgi:hypothetical protein